MNFLAFDEKTKKIVGWLVVFAREESHWFVILLDSGFHKRGLGMRIISKAKDHFVELNGWVVDHNNNKLKNGRIYLSPLRFYLKNDFFLVEGSRLELPNLSAAHVRWKM